MSVEEQIYKSLKSLDILGGVRAIHLFLNLDKLVKMSVSCAWELSRS